MSDSDGDPVCGSRDTSSGDPCQNPVDDPGDRCHLHPDSEQNGGDDGTDPHPDLDPELLEPLPDPPDQCPDCGSSNIRFRRRAGYEQPHGYSCRSCDWNENYCMEPLEDGHCHNTSGKKWRCDEHSGSDDDDDSKVASGETADLPSFEECPSCGSDELEPIRPTWNGDPRGWNCSESGCGWSERYCMAETDDGHCHRKVSGWGRCYMHSGDSDVPDKHGAPEGNENAVGNSGGEAGKSGPPGNMNAMQHGVYMSLKRRLEAMSPEQRESFKGYFQTYVEDCQNPTRAARIATAEVLADEIEVDLFGGADSLTRLVHTENGSFQQFKKDEVQALKALTTEVRMSLKDEGVTDNSGGSSGHDNIELLVTGDSS